MTADHSGPQVILLVDHNGDTKVGGCPQCLNPVHVAAVLREAANFVEANPAGRDRLDGRW